MSDRILPIRDQKYDDANGHPLGGQTFPGVNGPMIFIYAEGFRDMPTLLETVAHESYHTFDMTPQSDSNGKGPAYWWGEHCAQLVR